MKAKITSIETGETGQVKEGTQQEKGVVGLLQERHFHGAADVRLRINFYEQLQLSVSQKAGEVLRTERADGRVGESDSGFRR